MLLNAFSSSCEVHIFQSMFSAILKIDLFNLYLVKQSTLQNVICLLHINI